MNSIKGGRPLLLLLAVGMFALGTDGYVIAGLLPDVGRDLGIAEGAAGQLITVFALAYAVGAPLLGIATAGWPRRMLLIVSLGGFSAANVATALVDSYELMLAVRVVAALSAAAFTPAASATAAALAPAERRGRALATVAAGISLATAVGVPLGTVTGSALGWRATFMAVAVLGALATAGLAVLLPAVQTPPAAGFGEGIAVARVRGVPTQLAIGTVWIAGAFTVYTYISAVLDAVADVRGGSLSVWLLVFGFAAVVGNYVGGRAADRHDTGKLSVISTAGLTIALASLGLLATLGITGGVGAVLVAVALAVWGVFGWSFNPIQQHRMVALTPESAGVVLSLNASAVYIGISLGGLAGSIALDQAGAAGIGWTGAAIELVAVLVTLAVALRHRRSFTTVTGPSRDLAGDPVR